MDIITAETARNADGIMDSLYRNAVKLAQNAQGRDEVTDDEIERAFAVLVTESLKREDTREIVAKAIAVSVGQTTGAVRVG